MTDEETKTKKILLRMIGELKGEGGYLVELMGRLSALAMWLKAKGKEDQSQEFTEFSKRWEKTLGRALDDLFDLYFMDENGRLIER